VSSARAEGAFTWTVGATVETTVVQNLTRARIVQYAGASGDFNPLHTDEPFATDVGGHRGVFAHGMLTMALTARAVTELVGAEHVRRLAGRFKAQVWPGDDLVVRLLVSSVESGGSTPVATLDLSTVNQDGVEVFAGSAAVVVPRTSD
jgi:acyl dehydratase